MEDALAAWNAYRAESWATVIQECSANGLSNWEFCRQCGISEKSYYYWLRKFQSTIAEVTVPQLVQLKSVPTQGTRIPHITQYLKSQNQLCSRQDILRKYSIFFGSMKNFVWFTVCNQIENDSNKFWSVHPAPQRDMNRGVGMLGVLALQPFNGFAVEHQNTQTFSLRHRIYKSFAMCLHSVIDFTL